MAATVNVGRVAKRMNHPLAGAWAHQAKIIESMNAPLLEQGLVVEIDRDFRGFPIYELTDAGRTEAAKLLSCPDLCPHGIDEASCDECYSFWSQAGRAFRVPCPQTQWHAEHPHGDCFYGCDEDHMIPADDGR